MQLCAPTPLLTLRSQATLQHVLQASLIWGRLSLRHSVYLRVLTHMVLGVLITGLATYTNEYVGANLCTDAPHYTTRFKGRANIQGLNAAVVIIMDIYTIGLMWLICVPAFIFGLSFVQFPRSLGRQAHTRSHYMHEPHGLAAKVAIAAGGMLERALLGRARVQPAAAGAAEHTVPSTACQAPARQLQLQPQHAPNCDMPQLDILERCNSDIVPADSLLPVRIAMCSLPEPRQSACAPALKRESAIHGQQSMAPALSWGLATFAADGQSFRASACSVPRFGDPDALQQQPGRFVCPACHAPAALDSSQRLNGTENADALATAQQAIISTIPGLRDCAEMPIWTWHGRSVWLLPVQHADMQQLLRDPSAVYDACDRHATHLLLRRRRGGEPWLAIHTIRTKAYMATFKHICSAALLGGAQLGIFVIRNAAKKGAASMLCWRLSHAHARLLHCTAWWGLRNVPGTLGGYLTMLTAPLMLVFSLILSHSHVLCPNACSYGQCGSARSLLGQSVGHLCLSDAPDGGDLGAVRVAFR
jgi:hypothetical protein